MLIIYIEGSNRGSIKRQLPIDFSISSLTRRGYLRRVSLSANARAESREYVSLVESERGGR